ncbi:MAG: helix-turn-helix domain-containing protein [Gammaproteobacteria bacterium]|nr:helix-turn-helix domain-containing protein [Gammaproteobacteria bacterium]
MPRSVTWQRRWLDVDGVLGQFGGRGAARAYERFVREGIERGSPWGNLRGQIWLGDEAFLKRMQRLAQGKSVANVPRAQQGPARATAGALTHAVLSEYRIKDEKTLCLRKHQEAFQAWVYLLRRAANLTLREAARRGNVSPSRVSKIQSGLESGPIPATLRQLLERVPKAR